MNKGNNSQNTKTGQTDICRRVFSVLAAHPYLCTFVLCFLTVPLFWGSCDNMSSLTPAVFFIVFCAEAAYVINIFCKKHGLKFQTALPLTIAAVAGGLLIMNSMTVPENRLFVIFSVGCIMLSALYSALYTPKLKRQFNAAYIMGLSFIVKFCYVLGTSVYDRQHDIGWFGNADETVSGHLGYISYLFHNHHLYPEDYREFLQYCHPPLHHAICAVWISFWSNVMHIDIDKAIESAQILPLFYAMTISISAYRIFRHFRLEGKALYIPLILTAFHPCFTFLSSLMNNDPLTWAFTMAAIFCTLKWYESPTLKNIMKISLCMGLGMMSKLSAGLAAPPIAIVFLIVFVRSFKTSWKKFIGQFAAFGAVCVPLGMWFPLRGLIRFGIPLTYVQELPELPQSLKGMDFMKRITDFSPIQFKCVFENWLWYDDNGEPQSFNEHNPLIAILKNSIFSENINENTFADHQYMIKISKLLFWLGTAIAAAAFISIIVNMFRKCAADRVQKLLLGTFYAILVGNLYMLSKNYPMVCSMNFRYLMPTVVIGALFLGFTLSGSEKNSKDTMILSIPLAAASCLFAAMSAIVYLITATT